LGLGAWGWGLGAWDRDSRKKMAARRIRRRVRVRRVGMG
jgi:hypothetical protein